MNDIQITIDNKICQAKEGETILNIARRNGIFIPAICYLNGCSPTLACRLCLVDIDGKRAYSCNAKAKEGMNVVTQSEEIESERRAIMQVYDINHPLECGVCDQSGECELQDYTLELGVERQKYCIRDTHRPTQDWGLIHYDPSLCILCERCITVSKDMIGDNNLKTVPRGGDSLDKEWKDKMPKDSYATWNKMQKSIIGRIKEINPQEESGECIAVCPVGALVSSDFQYKSNAWELKKIPASNPHSSDCSLMYYDVKDEKIFRVSSDYSFAPLNGAARFGFDFQNEVEGKDEKAFRKIVSSFENGTIKQIEFTSFITNEEALILQKLKEKFDLNLVNEDARRFKKFLDDFSKTSGSTLYNGNIDEIRKSNFLVSLGTFLRSDSPNLSYAFNNALKMNKGSGFYFSTFGDNVVQGYSKNLKVVSHKIGAQEAILYLLLDKFGDKEKMSDKLKEILDSFKETKTRVVSKNVKEQVKEIVKDENGEEKEVSKTITKKVEEEEKFQSSKLYEIIGCEDLEGDFTALLAKKDRYSLIAGEDLIRAKNSSKLAKLLGLIQRLTPFSVTIIPPQTNTLGVSLICDLNEKKELFTLGYNLKSDLTISALGEGDLDMPSLNQQEGTFTNLNKRVVPTNVALRFKGYCLNDIAKALGLDEKYTISYTEKLPQDKGYKSKKFDDLPNYFDNGGVEYRGYLLDIFEKESEEFDEDLNDNSEEMEDFIYMANPVNQFSPFTNKAHLLQTTAALHVSEDFLKKYKLNENSMVKITNKHAQTALRIKKDNNLTGIIAYMPNFDTKVDAEAFFSTSRFAKVEIEEIR